MTGIIEQHVEDTVTVSLLLTRRCNFRCEHCFYECGKEFRGYMGDSVLSAVYQQVRLLLEHDASVSVNLVGGEPTLNMKRFGEILAEVASWGTEVQMTTNGWWLHEDTTARKFFNTVARHVDYDGEGLGGCFSVRISDDQYHDRFRPAWLQNGRMKHRLADVWDSPWESEILYRSKPVCYSCDRTFRHMPDDETCPGCNGCVEYEDEELLDWRLPQPAEGDPWIYTEHRNGRDRGTIIPTGRANCWGANDVGNGKGYCANGLSYLPNGKLIDICCGGSQAMFGDVNDDPFLLLELARRYVKEVKPHCYDCWDNAADWKRKRLRTVRREIERQLEREYLQEEILVPIEEEL